MRRKSNEANTYFRAEINPIWVATKEEFSMELASKGELELFKGIGRRAFQKGNEVHVNTPT